MFGLADPMDSVRKLMLVGDSGIYFVPGITGESTLRSGLLSFALEVYREIHPEKWSSSFRG